MEDYFTLRLTEDEIRAISSIGLAHLGDAVYELLVRSWLCAHGRATGRGLHRAAVELVRAPSQAVRADRILPLLTEAELALLRRLGETPFLPIAAAFDRKTPVYLEDPERPREQSAAAIQGLAAKGLLCLDYDIPLKNFDYAAADQGLRGIAPHASQAEHRHMCPGQALHALPAQQQLCP